MFRGGSLSVWGCDVHSMTERAEIRREERGAGSRRAHVHARVHSCSHALTLTHTCAHMHTHARTCTHTLAILPGIATLRCVSSVSFLGCSAGRFRRCGKGGCRVAENRGGAQVNARVLDSSGEATPGTYTSTW